MKQTQMKNAPQISPSCKSVISGHSYITAMQPDYTTNQNQSIEKPDISSQEEMKGQPPGRRSPPDPVYPDPPAAIIIQ